MAIERKEGRKKERKATSQFDSPPPRFDGGGALPPWDKMIVYRLHLVLISIQTGNLKDKNPTQQKEPSKSFREMTQCAWVLFRNVAADSENGLGVDR